MPRKQEEQQIAEKYRAIPKLRSFTYVKTWGHGKGKKKIKHVTTYKYPTVEILSFEDFKQFFIESGWYLNGNDFLKNPVSGAGVVFHPKDATTFEDLCNELHCILSVEEMNKIANHKTIKKKANKDGVEYDLYLKIDDTPGWRS